MNIGSGPAFNVTYQLASLDPEGRALTPHSLVHILNDEANPIPVPVQTVSHGRWSLTVTCESLSKRRYETTIIIDDKVLMTVEHREIK
jgi:hypothetical protein